MKPGDYHWQQRAMAGTQSTKKGKLDRATASKKPPLWNIAAAVRNCRQQPSTTTKSRSPNASPRTMLNFQPRPSRVRAVFFFFFFALDTSDRGATSSGPRVFFGSRNRASVSFRRPSWICRAEQCVREEKAVRPGPANGHLPFDCLDEELSGRTSLNSHFERTGIGEMCVVVRQNQTR